ncbi:MAG: ABC transporter permease [Hyphomicrobiaceae bacterium]|nr:ABC transporter permease [Hyphomicrobiaceae bacterium]
MSVQWSENAMAGSAAAGGRQSWKSVKQLLLQYSHVVALVILISAAAVASPYFFEVRNIMNLLRGAAPMGVVAIGMTIVILSRGIDLSVGSILGVAAMVTGIMAPLSPALAIPAALAAGTVLGAVNGVLITKARLQPFIATLAMLIFARGLVYIVTDGANIVVRNPPEWFLFIGSGYVGPVPVPVIIAALVWAAAAYALGSLRFGRHVYAVGANEDAARLYGIAVDWMKIKIYAISGLLAAVAGIILVSRLTVAEPNAGQLIELDAISAALIGGTTFDGGIGGVHGTILGILILAILGNILNLLGISPFVQMLLQGVIIVVAVIMSDIRSRVKK